MSDSEVNSTETQPVPQKPAGPTSILVRDPNGNFREALKGPDGKFVRKPRKLATVKDIQVVMREFLESPLEKGLDGKMHKRSKARLQQQLEAMHELATNKNPDVANAAVKAAELLWLRAYGKPAPSDRELAALETSSVKFVIVQAPELMHPDVLEEKPRETPKPAFIDGEVVSDIT